MIPYARPCPALQFGARLSAEHVCGLPHVLGHVDNVDDHFDSHVVYRGDLFHEGELRLGAIDQRDLARGVLGVLALGFQRRRRDHLPRLRFDARPDLFCDGPRPHDQGRAAWLWRHQARRRSSGLRTNGAPRTRRRPPRPGPAASPGLRCSRCPCRSLHVQLALKIAFAHVLRVARRQVRGGLCEGGLRIRGRDGRTVEAGGTHRSTLRDHRGGGGPSRARWSAPARARCRNGATSPPPALRHAACEHRAGEVSHRDPGQHEKAAIVDHVLEVVRPGCVIPANPAVTGGQARPD